ncbi:MAG: hypothetical protein EXS35_03245 [Pedosphaera sp.]|nr:hypothetical protein [Pedosphaera sp.]
MNLKGEGKQPPVWSRQIVWAIVASCAVANAFAGENVDALFKELATPGTSGERRDALVTELSTYSFSEVGTQAVRTICANQEGYYYNPQTAKPWLEERCPEKHRIWFAAGAIWHRVLNHTDSSLISVLLAELSLVGSDCERTRYLSALRFDGFYTDSAKPILERIASGKSEPAEIRVHAATILVQKADPNAYLQVLIESCEQIKDPLVRSERFRDATVRLSGKLSDANTKLFLNYGFKLLTSIDNGESGKGYFLAMDLGRFIGIKPIREGASPFMPDQHLPEYKDEHGLNVSFFQTTVNNAMKWWREHQKSYSEKN